MKILLTGLRWLLFPVACLYACITTVRNWLYDRKLLKSHTFPFPVICIGNLTVGGTGKTPHTEYLIRLLKQTHRITTLSRGYGRTTKGFRWVGAESTAQETGDEPLQFYQKFGSEIRVAVGEDRAAAIRKIVSEGGFRKTDFRNSITGNEGNSSSELRDPNSGIILLDDAFQHRAVTASFSILLTDYNRLFYKDFLLPTGNLRETRNGARRADVVIVSKCPDALSPAERDEINANICRYARPGTSVFFTGIRYGTPVGFHVSEDSIFSPRHVLVSGIAQPGSLESYVRQTFDCQWHLNFRDHHAYTQADVEKIQTACLKAKATTVLTTEKDYVKLAQLKLPPETSFYYLPIEIRFLFDGQAKFNQLFGS